MVSDYWLPHAHWLLFTSHLQRNNDMTYQEQLKEITNEGWKACLLGNTLEDNPYESFNDSGIPIPGMEDFYHAWKRGWLDKTREVPKDIEFMREKRKAYNRGYIECTSGGSLENCEYSTDTEIDLVTEWMRGWAQAEKDETERLHEIQKEWDDVEDADEYLRQVKDNVPNKIVHSDSDLRYAYSIGYMAQRNNRLRADCPYDKDLDQHSLFQAWNNGYNTAWKDMTEGNLTNEDIENIISEENADNFDRDVQELMKEDGWEPDGSEKDIASGKYLPYDTIYLLKAKYHEDVSTSPDSTIVTLGYFQGYEQAVKVKDQLQDILAHFKRDHAKWEQLQSKVMAPIKEMVDELEKQEHKWTADEEATLDLLQDIQDLAAKYDSNKEPVLPDFIADIVHMGIQYYFIEYVDPYLTNYVVSLEAIEEWYSKNNIAKSKELA